MAPGCVVQRRAGGISKGKILPAVHMRWFEDKQLEV